MRCAPRKLKSRSKFSADCGAGGAVQCGDWKLKRTQGCLFWQDRESESQGTVPGSEVS